MSKKHNIQNDARRLKQQLEATQKEISDIKNSKAFNTIRIFGKVRDQFRESPTSFMKKAAKKVFISKGGRLNSARYFSKNITNAATLESEYKEWIVFNEPDATDLEVQRKHFDLFQKKPLISIITPVFNPPVGVLKDLIESVSDQTYSNFELCLGNFGDNQEVKDLIESYSSKDGRIKNWVFRTNKGIAENSNQILKKVSGEYVALLDHDDTISPDALYENVVAINEDNYDFIYSDKDKIDIDGNRFDPFFKPDWSPEIMLNANYLTHLNLMRTSLVTKVGGWSSDTDGAQDWDIFLKVISISKKIKHISKVLYHWRVISTSTSMSIETKPYALKGQRVAVDNYMKKNKIPAKSYHVGAELLLKWENYPTEDVNFLIHSSSVSSAYKIVGSIKGSTISGKYYILHEHSLPKDLEGILPNVCFVGYKDQVYVEVLNKTIQNLGSEVVVLVSESINLLNITNSDINSLSGWLNIKGVYGAGPRVTMHDSKFAVDCGAVVTSDGLRPIFYNSPPYHQTPIGNIEWVRNLRVVASYLFVTKKTTFLDALLGLKDTQVEPRYLSTLIQAQISQQGRLVFNPKVLVEVNKGSHIDTVGYYEETTRYLSGRLPVHDEYGNINLSSIDPMRLAKIAQTDFVENDMPMIPEGYQDEAYAHAITNSLSRGDIQLNIETITSRNKEKLNNGIKTVVFILPGFNAIYAGLNNIFTYMDSMRKRGAKIHIALMVDSSDIEPCRRQIAYKFSELEKVATISSVNINNADLLPSSDMAVCTQWATAYVLARYNETKRKCYFIQDKEASFYAKGTISALVENTYRFGFFGIANTPGLLNWYEKEYGGKGVVIKSVVDLSAYSPDINKPAAPSKPYKVFFYARPNEPRNAFELGIAGLIELKKHLGTDVDIYTAGAQWDTSAYGVEDILTNLGKIAYDKLPTFYRSMDAGLMFMFSGHPGVVASELMASGCPVVVNEYDDITWHELYQHEKTCLMTIATASEVARNIKRCLEDERLRKKLIDGGLKKAKEFYVDYEKSQRDTYDAVVRGDTKVEKK